MKSKATPEGTPGPTPDAEAWPAIAASAPAFFVLGVDEETKEEARSGPGREVGRKRRAVPSGEN